MLRLDLLLPENRYLLDPAEEVEAEVIDNLGPQKAAARAEEWDE